MPHLFDPISLGSLRLKNRVVMPPMCMYSAAGDGLPTDWHLAHYGARAVGGAGLVIIEATAVESRGRITTADLGLWSDAHVEPLARIVRFCQQHGAKVAIQLGHAGRKAWSDRRGVGPETAVAPSAVAYDADWVTPRGLAADEMGGIVEAFRAATVRARAAGFDAVEIHAAHGYLLSSFLSPLANARADEFGVDSAGRARLARHVVAAVRAEWPAEAPVLVRLSCTDWAPGGVTIEDTVLNARALRDVGAGVVHCSSGGVVNVVPPVEPGYQVRFAERVRRDVSVPTIAVGLITEPRQADGIVVEGQADLIALGRQLLREPSWPLRAARELGVDVDWPKPYQRAKI